MQIFIIIALIFWNVLLFSIVPDQLLLTLRAPKTDPKKFRDVLESVGEYLALDALEALPTKEVCIQTVTGEHSTHFVSDEIPALITIVRAGLKLHTGIQKIFPN